MFLESAVEFSLNMYHFNNLHLTDGHISIELKNKFCMHSAGFQFQDTVITNLHEEVAMPWANQIEHRY